MNKEEFYTEVKLWPFSRKKRTLLINNDIVKYNSPGVLGESYKVFARNEIKEFRWGVNWLHGLIFYIGREYQVFLRNKNNEEISIRFRTYYGFRKKQLHKQFNDIVQALWKFMFWPVVKSYIDKFNAGEDFELCGVRFIDSGIYIKAMQFVDEETKFIPWDSIGTRQYVRYFAIYSLLNPEDINHGYYFHTDWNASVLQSVVTSILEHKKEQGAAQK